MLILIGKMPYKLYQPFKKLRSFFNLLGPGIVTGAADDDPSGIATFSQAGAIYGYQQLWTALYVIPFMYVVQECCGRIGSVTGKGLAQVMRQHYNHSFLYFICLLLLIINIINIGADLGAMANSLQLIFPISFIAALIGIAVFTLLVQVFVPYKKYSIVLKYLALAIISYIFAAFFVKQDWHQIMQATFIPKIQFEKKYILNIVAILGTTISPYLFFWQANQEVEEEVAKHIIPEMGKGKPVVSKKKMNIMQADIFLGMFFSSLITWFIMITTASTLHNHGILNIQTADQAASALKPFAGNFAFILFALGIIGTGLIAIPVLSSSASYAICEALKFKEGLSKKLRYAPFFYAVIVLATVFGLLINFLDVKPFQMLYYTAALNGVSAPPLLIMIFLISNNKTIMKKRTNSLWTNIMSLMIIAIMSLASIALIIELI